MGIDNGCAIVVGLHRDKFDSQVLEQLLDDDQLDQFCPCFDGHQDAICGIKVYKTDWHKAIDSVLELTQQIDRAHKQFKDVTGIDGQLYLTLNVW